MYVPGLTNRSSNEEIRKAAVEMLTNTKMISSQVNNAVSKQLAVFKKDPIIKQRSNIIRTDCEGM